ncbi:FAD-dependent oxidoreductase [Rhodanobacter sp. L36]|uniref:NAD(P)/FAD-dependent oxidoreductase n=1 Tax=Rhodanobacter sp. L36 TaxID=1747221 RepID=UPI00131B716E|nr:FAD-dependent oxidoreductase [Rhodanobacter sp. L36]
MDLKSGYPFWAIKNGLMHAFPQLQKDLRCDVAIIGGGISGALIANELAEHGHDVAVFEERDIGWGSSAASTALLQYEIDTHMIDLAKWYGEDDAALAYRACADAIPMLQALSGELRDVDFGRMYSLYYASRRRHVPVMQEEMALRRKHGFEVSWLEPGELRDHYGIDAPGAILSELAARIDPYRMAYRLFTRLEKRGAGVFDRTRIERLDATDDSVTLQTADGVQIHAKHVVFAAGYASQKWLHQRVARDRSSYAFITDPLNKASLRALADTMVWESARPYLYMRSTGDGRLLVGGEDDDIDIPIRRDARVDKKARTLVKKVTRALPGLELAPAFAWAGTFAETDDGLPFFGTHEQYGPRVQFAMAYGGNGISYSMAGAPLIRALIERRPHLLADLFSFDRLKR